MFEKIETFLLSDMTFQHLDGSFDTTFSFFVWSFLWIRDRFGIVFAQFD
jgi:hypothetical protein